MLLLHTIQPPTVSATNSQLPTIPFKKTNPCSLSNVIVNSIAHTFRRSLALAMALTLCDHERIALISLNKSY